MPKTMYCPFWKWSDARCVHCEGGKLTFDSAAEKKGHEGAYCGHRQGWRSCPTAQALEEEWGDGLC